MRAASLLLGACLLAAAAATAAAQLAPPASPADCPAGTYYAQKCKRKRVAGSRAKVTVCTKSCRACDATEAGEQFCTTSCPGGTTFDTSVCYECDDDACEGAVSPSPATLAVAYDARRCADGAVGADEVAAYGGLVPDSGCVLVPASQAEDTDAESDGEDSDTDDDE